MKVVLMAVIKTRISLTILVVASLVLIVVDANKLRSIQKRLMFPVAYP
jgi:hypothetical protein